MMNEGVGIPYLSTLEAREQCVQFWLLTFSSARVTQVGPLLLNLTKDNYGTHNVSKEINLSETLRTVYHLV